MHNIFNNALTEIEADLLLQKWRDFKAPQFPFVPLPADINAVTLQQQSPFLLLTILTACLEDDLPRQKEYESEVKAIISSKIIMRNERNVDLLQGLLVHSAWYQYHSQSMHSQAYTFLQVALMMAVDLDLDKDGNFGMRSIFGEMVQSDKNSHHGLCHSYAGMRALLACYYLCSV